MARGRHTWESGQAIGEYAVVIAGIAVVCLVAALFVGSVAVMCLSPILMLSYARRRRWF